MKTSLSILINSLSLLFFLSIAINTAAQVEVQKDGMNNKKMDAIFKAESSEMDGALGNWQLMYKGDLLIVLTDEANNRMRIFTPVVEEKKLEDGQMKKMLEANFHSALDSKYSLYEGYVISVFTHPLNELTKDQLIDAMQQVVVLARTFGDTYSSTDLIFAPKTEEEQSEEKKKEEKKINRKPKKT